MSTACLDETHWSRRLEDLVNDHPTPGATLGIALRDQRLEVAAGTLNVATGVPVTPDAVFQLGSVTKPYTATLVVQLAEEGKLTLDQPLAELLPELELADRDATRRIAVRQLLSHTSGIEGDHIVDTGRGDDALERFVAACSGLRVTSPPGATMSYCNTGFSLAGRIIEKLTGRSWEEALRTRLCEPAGLRRTAVLPEDLLRFPLAYGHVVAPDRSVVLAPAWTPPRSLGAAGYVCASVGDVLDFADIVLREGVARSGRRVLSSESVRAMLTPAVTVPEPWLMGSEWGLGWALREWGGLRLFGHDGDGIGHCTYLWVAPELELSFVLMTNYKASRGLFIRLVAEVFRELAGIEVPRVPVPPDPPPDVAVQRYVGTYAREGTRLDVFADEDGLRLRSTPTDGAWFGSAVSEMPLIPVDTERERFVTGDASDGDRLGAVFLTLDGSRYLHYGMRATPRVAA